MKGPLGVRWIGDNMAEMLAYIGHGRSCVNSFGDPVVEHDPEPSVVVELGDWVFELEGEIYVVSDHAWRAVEMMLMFAKNYSPMEVIWESQQHRAAFEHLHDGDDAA